MGPIKGPEKTKFIEKGPKIRKNLAILKKSALQKKPGINPVMALWFDSRSVIQNTWHSASEVGFWGWTNGLEYYII